MSKGIVIEVCFYDLGEYGNPINALKAKDYESVFVLAHPERVPLHNLYEALWFFKTGFPRYIKMLIINFLFLTDLIQKILTSIIKLRCSF